MLNQEAFIKDESTLETILAKYSNEVLIFLNRHANDILLTVEE